MRRSLLVTLFALSACTSSVRADSLDDVEHAAGRSPGVLVLPDAEPEPQGPELTLDEPEHEGPYLELDLESYVDYGRCAFEVQAHGLPAVHRTKGAVAYLSREAPGNADGPLPAWLVEESLVTGAVSQHDITVYIDDAFEEPKPSRCAAERLALELRIRQANERLASYRTLPRLDVVGEPEAWLEDEDDAGIRGVPARVRPVQVGYSGKRLVFRVPGIEVVHAQAQNWWIDDDFCQSTPNVRRVFADSASGIAVAEMDYSSGACLCDDGTYHRVVTLPSEVFAAAQARPTNVLTQDEDA